MTLFLDSFGVRFREIDRRSRFIISELDSKFLYQRPRELPRSFAIYTCGEYILRSAASVEQTFGGISTTLWDDPFEWTLPEKLNTKELIIEYLDEVEYMRAKTWNYFKSDEDLSKQINSPEGIRTIFDLLIHALAKAENFQGRAAAIFQHFTDTKLPRT